MAPHEQEIEGAAPELPSATDTSVESASPLPAARWAAVHARLGPVLATLRKVVGAVERFVSRWASFFGLDGLYIAVILALTYGLFLNKWPIWEDQSIYHYMAWSVRHGGVLYRDTINMNWPGTIMVHVVAQWMTGSTVGRSFPRVGKRFDLQSRCEGAASVNKRASRRLRAKQNPAARFLMTCSQSSGCADARP